MEQIDQPEHPLEGGAVPSRWLPFLIAAAIVVLDRFSKIWIRTNLSSYDSINVIRGWFRIVHTENPGAAFGVLADGNPMLRSVVLIGVAVIVLVFVVMALWKRSNGLASAATRLGLALILGGAAGNLYDRVTRGTVTDFLEVYNGGWTFPAFNVADSAITVGSAFLIIDLLRPRKKPATESPTVISN
ncbi:MAG: signal peptidase II [Bryobacteraceae bacterium]